MRLAARNGTSNCPGSKRPAFEALRQCRLQQPFRIVHLASARQALVRESDERMTGESAGSINPRCHQSLLGTEMIVLARLEALPGTRFSAQIVAVAELF